MMTCWFGLPGVDAPSNQLFLIYHVFVIMLKFHVYDGLFYMAKMNKMFKHNQSSLSVELKELKAKQTNKTLKGLQEESYLTHNS